MTRAASRRVETARARMRGASLEAEVVEDRQGSQEEDHLAEGEWLVPHVPPPPPTVHLKQLEEKKKPVSRHGGRENPATILRL